MRELATLLLVVLLVYLFQCLVWAGTHAFVFSLELSGQAGRRRRGFLWSALDLAGYWANLLPPLQPLVVVAWPEFQPGPESVTLRRGDLEPIMIPWEQLTLKSAGGKLLCNGVKVFHGGADQVKRHLDFLLALKRAKLKKRGELIENWLRQATASQAATARVELFRRKSRWLEFAANMQFFLLFIIVPMAFFRFGSKALWPLVAAALATAMVIAWQVWRLHKTFFPGNGEALFKSVFSTLLSPIYAIRATDALARDLLADFHPVVAAGILCSQPEFEAFAGEQLRANRFSRWGTSWYAGQLERALAATLEKKGLHAQRLLDAPEREEGCVVYCPRCRAQYTKDREDCADCGYGKLLAFENGALTVNRPTAQ
jgi:hypothetical protein